jgi:hypothetical protein
LNPDSPAADVDPQTGSGFNSDLEISAFLYQDTNCYSLAMPFQVIAAAEKIDEP